MNIYIFISVRGECGVQRIAMYYKRIGCYVWHNRCRVCFMLELRLHSRSAMYWVSGLRFNIPYLTGNSHVAHPSFLPLSGETVEHKWLLSDWCFWAFTSFHFRLAGFMVLSYFLVLFHYLDLWLFVGFMIFADGLWRLINIDFTIIIYYFILESMGITISSGNQNFYRRLLKYCCSKVIKLNLSSLWFSEKCAWPFRILFELLICKPPLFDMITK